MTWSESTLRQWLKESFIPSAFSAKESGVISKTRLQEYKKPSYGTTSGPPTFDQLFLLTFDEVEKYMPAPEAKQCFATPYAVSNGVLESKYYGTCRWWIRTAGWTQAYTSYVLFDGNIYDIGIEVNSGGIAVRPAMWITMK